MLDENSAIKVDGEEIGLIGIQNWGAGNFAKYGNLEKAYQHTDEYPVKILLSHDPSHWEAQVLPKYKDIDLALGGAYPRNAVWCGNRQIEMEPGTISLQTMGRVI
jgi:hypothetical protein